MLDDLNLPLVGLGLVFVAGCAALGLSSGPSPVAPPPQASSRIAAADLYTSASQVSLAEQERAAEVCTEFMVKRNRNQRNFAVGTIAPKDEEMPYYCRCVMRRAAGELTRFQFLIMEESLRVTASRTSSPFSIGSNERARSPEINALGREAMAHGWSRAQVQSSIDDSERVLNRVARECAADIPRPASPWQSSGRSRSR